MFLFVCLLPLTACVAHYPLNQEIGSTKTPKISYGKTTPDDESDSLILILAFSGGGTRAASLSYGILEALRQIEFPVAKHTGKPLPTMLDKVSAITAVSGGSFTAAYYGLHGEGIFKNYRERFLVKDVQGDLLLKLFNPLNWPRLNSPSFGRSDLAQEYYDEILFDKATLADMTGTDRPVISILATDAVEGVSFPFTQETFDLICSDFTRFPVSRAVAASSAVPGPLSPVSMKNYAGKCNTQIPEWIPKALKTRDLSSRTYYMAVRANTFLDSNKRPYIHLMDGGISDNLGLRAIIDSIMIRGGIRDSLKQSQRNTTRRIAFIIVDAETEEKPSWGFIEEVPGIRAILGASSTIMINKYNFETIDQLRRSIREWQTADSTEAFPLDFYLVHLNFNSLPEKAERDYFHRIPTTLSLPADQVDRLRKVAERLLYESPDFQKLVRKLGGKIPVTPIQP